MSGAAPTLQETIRKIFDPIQRGVHRYGNKLVARKIWKENKIIFFSFLVVTESTSSLIHAGPNFSINNRVRRRRSSTSSSSSDEGSAATKTMVNHKPEHGCSNADGDCCSRQQPAAAPVVLDIEDLLAQSAANRAADCSTSGGITNASFEPDAAGLCSTKFDCAGTSRQNCRTLISEYQADTHQGLEPLEFPENVDEHQTMRHTVLLILLLCAIFVVNIHQTSAALFLIIIYSI